MQQYKKYLYTLVACLWSVSLYAQSGSTAAPSGVRSKAYQHEVELSWATAPEGTTWRVEVDGRSLTTDTNSCTLERLEAGRDYEIDIYAVQAGVESAPVRERVRTQVLGRAIDDLGRIPYLRTVSVQGKCPQQLPLYYNDLANANAQISYKLNGRVVTPVNSRIGLDPDSVRETLEINIDEGEGRVWRIIYYLHVKK